MMVLERGRLLADETLTGAAWCEAHAGLVDAWLAELLIAAADGDLDGLALAAVGGFGRAELCPQSDIDVFLIHRRRSIASVADRIWYPVWDEALHLGHNVSTVREALRLASDDLDTATALLSARHIAGDATLTAELAAGGTAAWKRRSKGWLAELGTSVARRHEKAGEVAFALEPNLKEGRGGLRDAHALAWAEAAQPILLGLDEVSLSRAYSVLLDARVELQRHSGRASNVLSLEDQPAVATALGDPDPDVLMLRIADAARTIAWTSDDTWRRIRSAGRGPLQRASRRNQVIDSELHLRDGEIYITDAPTPGDPTLALRAAVAASGARTVIERQSLERLAGWQPDLADRWTDAGRDLFVQLLLAGKAAVGVIEALDERGIWAKILPEWQQVRARPQRNPYHRYTVDRHLLETVANAANLTAELDRPDLLVMAALLHDIGKGHDDPTEMGVALARRITQRMGFAPDDTDTIAVLVAQHLLLADVAARRDIDDSTTIEAVATKVSSTLRLRLLAALTEADSLATGPAAWGTQKAELVALLVERVRAALDGEVLAPGTAGPSRSDDDLERFSDAQEAIETAGDSITIITGDRPWIFCRVAGVLALHGLDVVDATARSTEDNKAMCRFRVTDPVREEIPWARVTADVQLALDGRLALAARLADRARTYGRQSHWPAAATTARASFDADASSDATVIDVLAANGIGVLYRITRALAELDLDIRAARVQTLGSEVVDAFYVRDAHGNKIDDRGLLAEIERAILHSLDA
jgi:[protein-PII] uridylyltransferase